jgi:putative ABC transport system permease protein
MRSLMRDVRFAIVSLRRSPGFAAAAMVTLAIGIAAVCSVFTLVNALLLEPLPYPEPDRIVFLRGELRRETPREYPLSVLDIKELARQQEIFASISPVTGMRPFNLAFGSEVEHVNGEMVSDEYFRVFSMPVTHGRVFQPAEIPAPGVAVAILSHTFWTHRFGSDPQVVGRTLTLNDRAFDIIGVASPGFRGVTGAADLFLPIGMSNPVYGAHYTDMRQFRWLSGVARLRPGVSVEQARQALEIHATNLAKEHPQENRDLFVSVTTLQNALFGGSQAPLIALLCAAAFVLLIGSVNVANLLLARGLSREREVAVRRALGAGSWRVLRQFMTESLVLAAPACLAGLLAAQFLTAWLAAIWAADVESFANIALDARVVVVTLLVTLASAVGFGCVPALSAARVSPLRGLGESSRGATISRARRRFQAALVVAEVALALTLLAGAALMTKGFSRFIAGDLGFTPEGLITLRLDFTADAYKDNDRYWSAIRSALESAQAAGGIADAALEGPGYPTGGYFAATFTKEGAAADAPQVSTLRHHVSPGYFRTLGIPLLAGRDFTESDGPSAPRAVVVSEQLAARTWPGENPIGRRILSIGPERTPWTVIGVVGNVKHEGRETVGVREPDIYLSILQSPARSPSLITVLARTSSATSAVTPILVKAVARAVPGVPPYDVQPMPVRLDEQTSQDRLAVRLMLGFAIAAVLLAVIGVYGVVSYTVTTRTRELGIRAALGATRSTAVFMVLRHAAWPVAIGVMVGVLFTLGLQRFAESLLFGLNARDPLVVGGSSAALLVIGIAAAIVPALRATRIDPVVALRAE